MFRRYGPVVFFFNVLALAALTVAALGSGAQAQTNIDQGKTPAEIFANTCTTCHKSARGLAAGKNSLTLTVFLREHYTASRDQASALAAYVLGNGGNAPAAPAQAQKPDRAHSAAVEEPKSSEAKNPETKGSKRHPAAKPEEETPAAAKLEHPREEEAKPDAGRQARPATASRGGKPEPETKPPAEEPAAPVPASTEAPNAAPAPGATETSHAAQSGVGEPGSAPAAAPSATSGGEAEPAVGAAAPGATQPNDSAPAERDNIPD